MKARLTFDAKSDPKDILAHVECLDPALVGHDAKLTITAKATVRDRRPENEEKKVFARDFRLTGERQEFRIPRSRSLPYTYKGLHVEVGIKAELRIDDGVVFNTKIKAEIEVDPPARPAPAICAKSVVEPKDRFKFWANWMAIPASNKVLALGLGALALIIGIVNTYLGVHDQFAPEGQTYVYSHRDSDGDSQSPLLNSGAVTGGAAMAVWFALRRQLRKYMTFKPGRRPIGRLGRDTQVVVGELFHGVSRVVLHDVTLRIVACNMERGQYRRGSGSSERIVSFTEPVRGMVLFEKKVAAIPAAVPVESYFPETVSFEPIFDSLFPPLSVSKTHGVDVYWEIQLIHDKFVDQELVGDVSGLVLADFHAPQAAILETASASSGPAVQMPTDAPLPADF